jgi:lysophospholipase L1-like esterase
VGLEHSLLSSDVTVKVAGLSGDQVVDGSYLGRIKLVQKQQFDWIIVMGGTNDLGWGKEPDVIYEGLSKLFLASLSVY